MSERRIAEGISGYWHYHMSDHPHSSKALCGAQTMHTSIPLSGWRTPFGEHYWPTAEHLLNAALLHQKRAESALASEREARERAERDERDRWIHHDTAVAIAQHLKPYLPINEDNVAEMLADIRMGLADRAEAIDSAIAAERAEKP